MRRYVITVGPLAAADADGICASQTPLGAGSLLINGALASGGVATLDKPRRVLITAVGNESGRTFTLTGTSTNYGNATISETIAGPNATTAQSVLDYSTVTIVSIDAASANAITVGTNGVASSKPLPLDVYARPDVALQATVTGTVNYTVSQTLDSPWPAGSPNYSAGTPSWTWVNHPDGNLVAATATAQGNYAYPPSMTRVTLNSGTGSVVFTVNQPGLIG